MLNIKTNKITSCTVRFFLNKNLTCETPYECDCVPVIPRVGEVISLTDGWEPCRVTDVVYNYPDGFNDENLLIDITAEDCEYEYGFEEDEEVWE